MTNVTPTPPAPVTAADTDKAIDVVRILVGDETQIDPDGEYGLMVNAIARALADVRQAQREADAVIAMEYNFDTAHFRKSTKQTALKSLGIFISDAIRAQAGKETK